MKPASVVCVDSGLPVYMIKKQTLFLYLLFPSEWENKNIEQIGISILVNGVCAHTTTTERTSTRENYVKHESFLTSLVMVTVSVASAAYLVHATSLTLRKGKGENLKKTA